MKALVWGVAALLVGCTPKGVQVNTTQLLDRVRALATEDLGLTPITCVDEVFKTDPEVACYSAPHDAEAFMSKVNAALNARGFKSVTGWRDDYGVASLILQYGDVPREISMQFERPTEFWKLPRYDILRKTGAQGAVVIGVSDDDPADRF
ncbi:hypothetical protein ACFFLM_17990 [Deinococcus oregonensis]|uniref:Lipoprotein n=1 Tax=Deinococcus oregonensis TaxID=1805970 RepID=A0ABV6B278_9DEIO